MDESMSTTDPEFIPVDLNFGTVLQDVEAELGQSAYYLSGDHWVRFGSEKEPSLLKSEQNLLVRFSIDPKMLERVLLQGGNHAIIAIPTAKGKEVDDTVPRPGASDASFRARSESVETEARQSAYYLVGDHWVRIDSDMLTYPLSRERTIIERPSPDSRMIEQLILHGGYHEIVAVPTAKQPEIKTIVPRPDQPEPQPSKPAGADIEVFVEMSGSGTVPPGDDKPPGADDRDRLLHKLETLVRQALILIEQLKR